VIALEESNWLHQVELFADLDESQLAALWSVAKEVDFPEGAFIFQEDESGDTLYILREGRVEVSKKITLLSSSEDKQKALVTLEAKKHPFFGEMALLTREVRSATLLALSPCKTLAISSKDFHRLCDADPRLGYLVLNRMGRVFSERLRRSNQDILNLTTALSLALRRK
jgi:CRP-like cAMP-binding protein